MAAKLTGSVALVTGASSGIGAATARELAASGAHVVLAARRVERLAELAEQIAASGGRSSTLPCDVTDKAQAADLVARTVAETGRLDVVVNNAGVMLLGPAQEAPLEEWERMVQLNLLGLMYVTHAALPHLVAAAGSSPRGVADLVNISSVAGRFPRAGSSGYNATKFAVTGLGEALRQELAGSRVRVCTIEPGAVNSELRTHLRPEVRAAQAERFASVEPLEAEDIAEMVAFVVTRPARAALHEIVVRPTTQV